MAAYGAQMFQSIRYRSCIGLHTTFVHLHCISANNSSDYIYLEYNENDYNNNEIDPVLVT